MEKEKLFLKPEAIVIEFSAEDVILTSVIDGGADVSDEDNPIGGII